MSVVVVVATKQPYLERKATAVILIQTRDNCYKKRMATRRANNVQRNAINARDFGLCLEIIFGRGDCFDKCGGDDSDGDPRLASCRSQAASVTHFLCALHTRLARWSILPVRFGVVVVVVVVVVAAVVVEIGYESGRSFPKVPTCPFGVLFAFVLDG